MYLKHWEFKVKPFENTPDPHFFYMSSNHEEALMRMNYCISETKGAAMLTGEYGSGKTLITRTLLKEFLKDESSHKVALIVNPSFSSSDFLREIVFQLDNKFPKGSKLEVMHVLNDILYESLKENKKVVVIVDEAQAIRNRSMFEELRMLLNFQMNDRFLLTLLLVGQPELRDKVDKIPQLKQRLGITYHLNGLGQEDVDKYISYRCTIAGNDKAIFSKEAVRLIADKTEGIPRKINNICELALLQGMFEKKEVVNEEIIKKVLEEVEYDTHK